MPKPEPLNNPSQSMTHRFTRLADRLRQFHTKFGQRPMRVFLVWTVWDGEERGEGFEEEAARVELLPTPRVTGWASIVKRPYASGTFKEGTIFVDEISAGAYDRDMLKGLTIPSKAAVAPLALTRTKIAANGYELTSDSRVDFFYEVREDERSSGKQERFRYRLYGEPDLDAPNLMFKVVLEAADEPTTRTGQSKIGTDPVDNPEDLVKGLY